MRIKRTVEEVIDILKRFITSGAHYVGCDLKKYPNHFYVTRKEDGSGRVQTLLYTHDRIYSISASTEGYLGCICQNRRADVGEKSTRGRDFPDGDLELSTWNKIMTAIAFRELEAIVDKRRENASFPDGPSEVDPKELKL